MRIRSWYVPGRLRLAGIEGKGKGEGFPSLMLLKPLFCLSLKMRAL